jgi:hypothetical protein
MNLEQAKKIIFAYKKQHGFDTFRNALMHMKEFCGELSLEQFVAKDIVSWGHSSHTHPLSK